MLASRIRGSGGWAAAAVALALVAIGGCEQAVDGGNGAAADRTPKLSGDISHRYNVDRPIGMRTLPAASGGDGALTYSLHGKLPGGLAFEAASRTLSGTPEESGTFTLTYRATDEDGDRAEITFTISITPLWIYWTEALGRQVRRAPVGGEPEVIRQLPQGPRPRGIALDLAAQALYWTHGTSITRIDLATRKRTTLYNDQEGDGTEPRAIALDVAAGRMYWTYSLTGVPRVVGIRATDMTGCADVGCADTLYRQTGGWLSDIALDVTARRIYFADRGADNEGLGGGSDGRILTIGLPGAGETPDPGTAVVTEVVTGLADPGAVALDLKNGHVYWTDSGQTNEYNPQNENDRDGKIQRANLDGTEITDVVTGLVNPSGIALDVAAQRVYFTDPRVDKIQRANLDGTGIEDLFVGDDAPSAAHIVLDLR